MLRIHEHAVRIEIGERAGDGVLHQLVSRHVVDVLPFHDVESLGEEPEPGVRGVGAHACGDRGQADAHHDDERADRKHFLHAPSLARRLRTASGRSAAGVQDEKVFMSLSRPPHVV